MRHLALGKYRHRRQPREQLAPVFEVKHPEAERRPEARALLASGLVTFGVIGERPRGDAELAGNKNDCCLRNDLALEQQTPRVAESTELQRTELAQVAATPLNGGEIGGAQCPLPD